MTEDSKAHRRFPQIDAGMIGRFERAALVLDCTGAWVCKDTKAGLEAALDRRTGPKCRRKELDDIPPSYPTRRSEINGSGRRPTDTSPWESLPRKSARLAREAAERKEEIVVSPKMKREGYYAFCGGPRAEHYEDALARAYVEMERARREELKGQVAAPCGASVPGGTVNIKDRRVNNERRGRRSVLGGLSWAQAGAINRRCNRCGDRRK